MKLMNDFLEKFTSEKISDVVKKGRLYYSADPGLQELAKGIEKDYFSIGVPLGEVKKDFRPSLTLLDWISKRTEKKAFVNKKAEWMFLCGRDVFYNNIVKKNVESGLVLVQNEKDENIGLGILSGGGIKNIIDRGDFLRREK
ncbi:MAG: hypothetical protein ABIE94_01325 [archaeon]